ncbi:hypothetical protein AAVH_18181 [Aphelenchoides avenae]|nr:hypothetical protein AAVH_18181 [Aphelenchus avenae]
MTSNAAQPYAEAVKSPQQTSPKQAAQGASSNNGGRPEDPAPLTPPLNTAEHQASIDSRRIESAVLHHPHGARRFQNARRREGLPVEVLGKILRWLPRTYLDRIQTSNRFIAGVIASASEPLDTKTATRRRVGLDVEALPNRSFKVTLRLGLDATRPASCPDEVVCRTAQRFFTAAANCSIGLMRVYVDELPVDLFNVLMRESHRWRLQGIIEEHPGYFANKDDFHRFFDELAVTQGKLTFDINRNLPFAIETPCFWNLGAVHHCQWLVVDHIPPQMEPPFCADSVLRWLAIPPSSLNWKRLHFHEGMLTETLELFCAQIHLDFADAHVPNQFRIRIRLRTRLGWERKDPVDNDVDERLYVHTEEQGGFLVILRIKKSEILR